MIESILNKLDRSIGIEFEDSVINNITYAEDVVLLARTSSRLQHLIDTFSTYALKANLEVNTDKTKVMSLFAMGKIKKIVIGNPKIKIQNRVIIEHLDYNSSVKYMGMEFCPSGVRKPYLISELTCLLSKLKKI